MSQRLEPVSAEHAYRAAVDRAMRVTEALIAAEARLLEVQGKVGRLEDENAGLRMELTDLREQHADRAEACEPAGPCEHWSSPSPCDWNVCRQKGGGDDGSTGDGSPAAVGEAVPAHPFSD